MIDCIFCKIVKNEVPSFKVYEDEKFLAFLDIFPRTKGHTIVIPKTHYRWVYDVPNFGKYWEVVFKVTKALQKTLKPDFINYITYGKDVEHAHVHIFPQSQEAEVFPDIKKISQESLKKISEKIKKGFLVN